MRWGPHQATCNLDSLCGFANIWGAHAARVLVSHPAELPEGFATEFLDFARNDLLMLTADVKRKPIAGEFGHLLQCTRLLKQVRCAGNNLQLHFAAHPIARHFV